ncbi:MAG: biotin/lipoyl-containing protein, partial [Solirubrobacterales bacterium]
HLDELTAPLTGAGELRAAAPAATLAGMLERHHSQSLLRFAPPGWRNNPSVPQRTGLSCGDREVEVAYRLGRGRAEGLEVKVDGEPVEVVLRPIADPARVDLEVEGVRRRYSVAHDEDRWFVNSPRGQVELIELPRYPLQGTAAAEGALVAPMPGKVLSLAVSAGEQVDAGQVVAVLEAMKMEHELVASASGAIEAFEVEEGDQVEAGATIARIGDIDSA